MSWGDVNGEFHQHKERGFCVVEVQLRETPKNPGDHAEHWDDYYYVGDKPLDDVKDILKACNLSNEYYGKKVVISQPRSSVLTITNGEATLEPDFFGSSEDVYWVDDNGVFYEWELNENKKWEKVYDH